MEKRISIYVGEPLAALLAGHENRSGRINNVAERYAAILQAELKRIDFTRGEWCAIFDAENGCGIGEASGDQMTWQFAWANMEDSPEMDEKWDIDHADLARRMRALSPAAKAAVYEAAIRFWQNTSLPTDEALGIAVPSLAAA